jgi:hypothetical protein
VALIDSGSQVSLVQEESLIKVNQEQDNNVQIHGYNRKATESER